MVFAVPAFGDVTGVEGMGRISAVVGSKWTPNAYFEGVAASRGNLLVSRTPGIQGAASFGYGITSWAEVTIDVYGGWESFELSGYAPFNSYIYGGLIGGRITKLDFPWRGFVPHLGVQAGPSVAQIASTSIPTSEIVLLGLSANAGLTYRFSDRFGITLDVRYLFARLYVPEIAGANVGGLFASIGATMYFPGSSERKDLSVPGF